MLKFALEVPKTESGLTQMITMSDLFVKSGLTCASRPSEAPETKEGATS